MAEQEVSRTDKWKVKTNHDGTFKESSLNGINMVVLDVGGINDLVVDLEPMDKDFRDFPNIEGGNVHVGNTYAYSLPIRNKAGQIIKWVCGGSGPYACGG